MSNFFAFIKSKFFLKQVIIAIIALPFLFWIIFKCLDIYTDHGNTTEVPDFTNVKLQDLDRFIADKDVRYTIIDSVYDMKKPRGVVVQQEPEPKTAVKHNRTIYLYVTSLVPQRTTMPNLLDASPRQAAQMLESYGLKLGKQITKPGLSCVLEQQFNGKNIKPGTSLAKGSVIDLVIGQGNGDEKISLPCVITLSKEEALQRLAENNLASGTVICEGCKTSKDSARARVYKQRPDCTADAEISSGSSVDIYLTLDPNKIPN